MLTDDWLGIDGDLDNLADIAYTDGDSGLGDRAYAIRDAGNAQNPGWPSTAAGFDHWPAAGQMSEISLTRKQWLLVERTLIESASDYAAIAREAGQTTTDTKPNQDEDWLGMSDDCRRMARFIHRELTRR